MRINIKIIIVTETLFCSCVFAVTNPTIEILPRSPVPYRLAVGDNLQLTCIYKSNDETIRVTPSKLVFYKDGIPLGRRFPTIRQHSGRTVTLVIYTRKNNGAKVEDSGYYRCSYLEWYYQILVQVIAISVNDAEIFIGYNGHYVYYSTMKNLTLECSPTFPRSNVSNEYSLEWFRKTNCVDQNTTFNSRVLAKGNKLNIFRADLEDIGEYQCVFTFQNMDSLNRTVLIKAPPIIMRNYFAPQHLEIGQNLSVDCHARGFPRPNIFWTKDQFYLQDNDRIQITIELGDDGRVSSTLQISNVTLRDEGFYHCNAESTAYFYGDDRYVTVSVYERAPPEILTLKAAKSSELSEWKVTCNATGFPFPDFYWFKDGHFIHHSEKYHVVQYIPRVSILVISNVSTADQGVYGCFVNSTGMMKPDYRTVTFQYYEPYYLAKNGSAVLTVLSVESLLVLLLLCLSFI